MAHDKPCKSIVIHGGSRPKVAVVFSLSQFIGVFEIHNDSGKPYIIIGGQAVNYWAEKYLRSEPELGAFVPFVSKDIDFIGGRDDVLKVARQLHLPVKFPHKKLMTAFAGAVYFQIGGVQANIEFIRTIPGVSPAEATKWAIASEYGGKEIRVVDPVSLLICKLNLALSVDQTHRRDTEHVRILLLCARGFLREILQRVETGELPARGWLGAVERVLQLAESTTGKKSVAKLNVDWQQVLPMAEIASCEKLTIIRFRTQRLLQWLEKIKRPSRR